MRKFFVAILLFAILPGCEKDFDEIIDVSTATYQVIGTSSFNSFRYVVGDSSITIFLTLNSSANIRSVFCDIIASDGNKLNANPVLLLDNGNTANGDLTAGDNSFTNLFSLSQQNPIGNYKINFYVNDNRGVTKLAAIQQFTYDNGQNNVAPVISNLAAPDTVSIGTDTTFILITINADDPNGLNDIEFVFFNSFIPPNGNPSSQNPIGMYDDGTNGDQTGDDGIFSRIVILPPTGVTLGTYRWEFQAKDRGGLLSNQIIHYVEVQ
ncbi:MAG: hypothetical protein Q7S39_09485 [Ignavibacteria bacterium]|nr:hypothetical protein [Ignavibacteria bacterium]